MKTTVITELVKIKVLETTSDEQLLNKVNAINVFLQKQDGFIDSQLIKEVEGNNWYIIYHIENFEKLKIIGEKLRNNKMFGEISPLIVQGSLNVKIFETVKNW